MTPPPAPAFVAPAPCAAAAAAPASAPRLGARASPFVAARAARHRARAGPPAARAAGARMTAATVVTTGAETAEATLAALLAANDKYADDAELRDEPHPPAPASLRNDLAVNGQKPVATIIACADSRVPPELMFRATVGDLFILRTAGNVTNDEAVLASVEFAVAVLKTPLVMVMGHSLCGAVKASIEVKKDAAYAGQLPKHLSAHVCKMADCLPAMDKFSGLDEEETTTACVEAHTKAAAKQLVEVSDVVKTYVANGDILVVPTVYDIDTGKVKVLEKTGAEKAEATLVNMLSANKMYAADVELSGKPHPPATLALRRELAINGQKPVATVISCADSRVPPELMFRGTVGDLFVLRTAGNVTNDEAVLASVEFAVAVLKTPLVLVLGHSMCGAVKASVSYATDASFGATLPKHLSSHIGKMAACLPPMSTFAGMDEEATTSACVESNARVAAKQLVEVSDVVKTYATNGDIKIVPAVYDIDTGLVSVLE